MVTTLSQMDFTAKICADYIDCDPGNRTSQPFEDYFARNMHCTQALDSLKRVKFDRLVTAAELRLVAASAFLSYFEFKNSKPIKERQKDIHALHKSAVRLRHACNKVRLPAEIRSHLEISLRQVTHYRGSPRPPTYFQYLIKELGRRFLECFGKLAPSAISSLVRVFFPNTTLRSVQAVLKKNFRTPVSKEIVEHGVGRLFTLNYDRFIESMIKGIVFN